MAWRLARSLEQLRRQIDAAYPGRSKASDGTIGDVAHSQRNSDHNPDAYGSRRPRYNTRSGARARHPGALRYACRLSRPAHQLHHLQRQDHLRPQRAVGSPAQAAISSRPQGRSPLQISATPASRIRCVIVSIDPARSMPRQACRITDASKPWRRASIAE
jgi:hypothetical protein